MTEGFSDRKLVVGLGNPGEKYSQTRHNAGFLVLDRLAMEKKLTWKTENRFRSQIAELRDDLGLVMVAKPQTYMNLSGLAVGLISGFFKLNPANILVVLDDADLPFGKVRMRPEGSSGGHHGLESIEKHLKTTMFPRLRVGISRVAADQRDIAGHVLGAYSDEEWVQMRHVEGHAADQILCWLQHGVLQAMNLYNGTVKGL